MKPIVRKISLLLTVLMLLSSIFIPPAVSAAEPTAQAADSGTDAPSTKKQKIVSVLFDTSSSMNSDHKNDYAKYALSILIAMLNDGDTLIITPLTDPSGNENKGDHYHVIEINDSTKSRQDVITEAFKNIYYLKADSQEGNWTHPTPIKHAVGHLTGRGMKDEDDKSSEEEKYEYWLVVLTDGVFQEKINNKTVTYDANEQIKKYTDGYPSMRKIFCGLGSKSPTVSGNGMDNFTSYRAGTENEIISTMQEVSNQLSGRQTLPQEYKKGGTNVKTYEISGSTITIDLGNCPYSFRSISVIAQNCGGVLESAVYTSGGNNKTAQISRGCILPSQGTLGWASSYSGVIEGDPFLKCEKGNKLVLTFKKADGERSLKLSSDNVSILVEPALDIKTYIEYKDGSSWKSIERDQITKLLTVGSQVRVSYEIFDAASNSRVTDVTAMFDSIVNKASYNGKDDYGFTVTNGKYVSDTITLVEKNNVIAIEVIAKTAISGKTGQYYEYKMYDSYQCNIFKEEDKCKVVASKVDTISYLDGKATVSFTIIDKNKQVPKANIAPKRASTDTTKYVWDVIVKDANGRDVAVNPTIDSNGAIQVEIPAVKGVYGNYTVRCNVVTPEKMDPHEIVTLSYNKMNLSVKLDSGSTSLSAESVSEKYVFNVYNGSTKLSADDLKKGTFTIKFNGKTYTPSIGSNGAEITVDAKALEYKAYDMEVSFKTPAIDAVENKIQITKAHGTYDFKCVSGPQEIKFGDETAEFKFEVQEGGKKLTDLSRFGSIKFELQYGNNNGNITTYEINNGTITVRINAEDLPYESFVLKGTLFEGNDPYTAQASFVKDKAAFDYKIEIGEVGENGKVPASTTEVTYKVSVTVNGDPIDEATLAERFGIKLVISAPEGNPEEKTFAGDAIKDFIKNGLKQSVIKAGDYKLEAVLLENGTEVANDSMSFEKEEGNFTVEITGPDAVGSDAGEIEYMVVIKDKEKGNAQLTKAELEKRQIELTVTLDDQPDNVIVCKIEDDGTVKFTVDMKDRSYGQYKIQAAITESGAAQGGNTKDISKYPSKFTVTVDNENGLSMTEHQFKSNEQSLIFKLFAEDDIPYDFNDTLIKFTLKLGGKVIDPEQFKDQIKIEGNTLIYTPVSEHNADITTGEYKISVDVVCNIKEEIKGERSVPLIIGDTKFVIVTLDSNKTVDRFDLKNLDAVIYFKVLRDGIPLSAEELQDALDSGTLAIDVSGVFGWMFWLPTGNEIAVETLDETVDGVAVVSVRVTRDWIDPFWSFASMMILNGDKEIKATYPGAEACSDHITFTPSGVWSYIWRILVILFVIHCILYIIGFFNGKCKNLPWGSVVVANPSPTAASASCDFYSYPINNSWWKRNSWHILRFFPHKKTLWYHQPGRYVAAARVTVQRDRNGNVVLSFKDDVRKFTYFNNGTQTADDFDAYKSALRTHKKNIKPKFDPAPQSRNVQNMFQIEDVVPAKRNVSSGAYYGTLYGEKHQKIDSIVLFVKHR